MDETKSIATSSVTQQMNDISLGNLPNEIVQHQLKIIVNSFTDKLNEVVKDTSKNLRHLEKRIDRLDRRLERLTSCMSENNNSISKHLESQKSEFNQRLDTIERYTNSSTYNYLVGKTTHS